VSDIVL
jgi:assimilatory nitrate reductase catalytic subunit